MSEFKEYRFSPPNVTAIKWDGKQETAQLIKRYFYGSDSIAINWVTAADEIEITTLYWNDFAVPHGDYIVIEQKGRPHLATKSEFEGTYTQWREEL